MALWCPECVRPFVERMLSRVLGDITLEQFVDLLLPGGLSTLVQRRRASLIVSRVRMVAALFALLTPLWIVIDVYVFPWPMWGHLALLRVVATAAFLGLVVGFGNTETIGVALRALTLLLVIPTVFFVIANPILATFAAEVGDTGRAVAMGYAFLPFVMVAGLSVFPVTATEGALLALPMVLAEGGVTALGYQVMPFASTFAALWLLILVAVVATLAGMSQLHFMTALVSQSAHDVLTRAFTRRVGEELLDLQVRHAWRQGMPLSLAFVDLDHFKTVNDVYGHEEGDATLRRAADALRRTLRRQDMLVRWGGEEFVVVMTGTDATGAATALKRLRRNGLGTRADGVEQTASIGLTERTADGIDDWQELVDKADERMYAAKQQGRDRVITVGDEALADV